MSDGDAWWAVVVSVRVATVAVLGMLVPGVITAWWLARSRSRWTVVVESMVSLPLVLPPVVVGYLLLRILGRRGWLGGLLHDHLGVDLIFTWWAAAIASAVMGFPLLVRSTRLAIELVDRDLERAAASRPRDEYRCPSLASGLGGEEDERLDPVRQMPKVARAALPCGVEECAEAMPQLPLRDEP